MICTITVEEMSRSVEKQNNTMLCASCGIAGAGGDDIKLKKCGSCDLVRYCSDECQDDHLPQHEEECKKRAAELRDKLLFRQPENSHLGDCPLCCLPLPIDEKQCILASCCSNTICNGCDYANQKREVKGRIQPKCAFCRKDLPHTDKEANERVMKRIEANDPVAMCSMGMQRYLERDYETAFEYWTRAASLGDIKAHYQLSCLYDDGQFVEKDEKKLCHHLTEAAIGGHPEARHILGCVEGRNGRVDRAVKHIIISAQLGYDQSLQKLKDLYKAGHVSKEDLTAALRGHYAAIAATKSAQREEAAEEDLPSWAL